MLLIVSCQKGEEPQPFSQESENQIYSNAREGGMKPLDGDSTKVNGADPNKPNPNDPKEDGDDDVIGGDDNEDDDDLDNGVGADTGVGSGKGTGSGLGSGVGG